MMWLPFSCCAYCCCSCGVFALLDYSLLFVVVVTEPVGHNSKLRIRKSLLHSTEIGFTSP